LDFFEYETHLHARHPRVHCQADTGENGPETASKACGVHRVEVPWARPGSGFTFLFEAMIMSMAPHMPVNAIARHVSETDKRLWRVLEHHVDEAREQADYSEVTSVGIDETSSRKHHSYISVIMDLDQRRVVFADSDRDHTVLARFAEDLEAHGGDAEAVDRVCMDMSPAYEKGEGEHLPNAEVTFDKFHLMKNLNEAVDEVRRSEQKQREGLKRTRYLWLKNQEDLDKEDQTKVASLADAYPKTGLAHRLKEVFRELWRQPSNRAEWYLDAWCEWAMGAGLGPVETFAKSIRSHWDGVVNWFQSQVDNGVLEGINSLIQAAKAKARGYSNDEDLVTMTYLIAGRLEFDLPT
jgi:transposase